MDRVFHALATRRLIELALAEDLDIGDVASGLLFDGNHRSSCHVIAKQRLVVAGLPLIQSVLDTAGEESRVVIQQPEGAYVSSGTVLATVEGRTAALLMLERTVLNFLQRLCGIATEAHRWTRAAKGMKVLDTRKTLPGFRMLDKYAVRIGGAMNHRLNLGSMAMLKNNHIDAGKSLGKSIGELAQMVRASAPLATPLEIEVRNLDELREAIHASPEVIMLDNFSQREIAKALKVLREHRYAGLVEVSGGVHFEELPKLRALGVTHVSVGALTHSVRAADISLRIESDSQSASLGGARRRNGGSGRDSTRSLRGKSGA